MTKMQTSARIGAASLFLLALGACTNTGSLGGILGDVLGTGSASQVNGTIQRVDTRYQQITMQQSNGQAVSVAYDSRTQVVYQNQSYPVTSLEYGDQVTARIKTNSDGSYYTDLVQVNYPASNTSTGSTGSETVQTLQGTVRQIDRTNGWFTLDTGGGVTVTVSLPYSPSSTDLTKFQSLRTGDYVRLRGVFLTNSRVELRQFY
jgi:hypothetical protein